MRKGEWAAILVMNSKAADRAREWSKVVKLILAVQVCMCLFVCVYKIARSIKGQNHTLWIAQGLMTKKAQHLDNSTLKSGHLTIATSLLYLGVHVKHRHCVMQTGWGKVSKVWLVFIDCLSCLDWANARLFWLVWSQHSLHSYSWRHHQDSTFLLCVYDCKPWVMCHCATMAAW